MYKQNQSLSLEEQMISPLPDITTMTLSSKDEFIIMASDGIWLVTYALTHTWHISSIKVFTVGLYIIVGLLHEDL